VLDAFCELRHRDNSIPPMTNRAGRSYYLCTAGFSVHGTLYADVRKEKEWEGVG